MERKDRIDAFGAVMLLAITLTMGMGQVLIKIVNAGMEPVFQAGLRSACAFPFVLAFALVARRRLSLADGSLLPGLLCGCLFAAEFLLLFKAMDYTSVARAVVLFYTMPVWVALGAHFAIPGETMTRARALGLALAVAGVAVALSHNEHPATDRALTGDLMALAGAGFWAAIAFTARLSRLSGSVPEMQLLYQLGTSAVILIALSPLFGPYLRGMTPSLWSAFALQVASVGCFAFLAWFWVLKHYPASDMASFGFLTPVFAVAFGWAILGEQLTPSLLLALALVAAGIVLVNRRRRR